jgi:DnaK suppressor protein
LIQLSFSIKFSSIIFYLSGILEGKMMLNKELEHQKKKLLQKRIALLTNLEQRKLGRDSHSDLSHGDDIDKATVSADLEIVYLLGDRKLMELKAIDRAIKKISRGEYGVCEICGKKVGKKRLEALPLTPFCRVCQSQME